VFSDLGAMILAARANPADEACLGALADLLAERGDPRERWLRRHIRLRAKLAALAEAAGTGPTKNTKRKLGRRRRRLDYALQANF
jgi:hypothetical protein